jgi:hypothetical protein
MEETPFKGPCLSDDESEVGSSIDLEQFECRVAAKRTDLMSHALYANLRDVRSLRVFMKYHVFAVWDFMSLLKSLQRTLTCVEVPWVPRCNSQAARIINEIVLAEETDEISAGTYMSHFELYLKAMVEVGADTRPILALLSIAKHSSLDFQAKVAQGGVWRFMATTFSLAARAPHEVAAAFLFGREDIIPEMFMNILKATADLQLDGQSHFRKYLERHIEVDGEHHGPLARKMLIELCGDDAEKWSDCPRAALSSIEARIRLWDFVARELVEASESSHAVVSGRAS